MKSACVGVLSIIEFKNARWNIEIKIRSVKTEAINSEEQFSFKKNPSNISLYTEEHNDILSI